MKRNLSTRGARWQTGSLLRSGLAIALLLVLLPSGASAGVVSPDGFTTAVSPEVETFSVGISPWGYEPHFPVVSAHQASGADVTFSGYAAASSYETLAPGSCFRPSGPNQVECGLAPAGGEPFSITGTDGEDVFREVGCTASPEGSACPRVFKIALYGGDDELSLWTFSDVLGDERDPSTGTRPWVAAARSPMDGVEIATGAGNDFIRLMGGPSTGAIDAGPGNDGIYTRGGYSEAQEPVTGGYAITCGSGFDTVQPGPGDKVAIDCERVVDSLDELDPEEEAPDLPADIASTCGFARFDFYKVYGERSFVRKRRRACVYLVSNRFARDLLQLAYNSDDNISQAFVDMLEVARRASRSNGSSPSQEALESYIRDSLSIPDGQDVLFRALPWWVQDGLETAGRANPLLLIGEATGSLAIPLATLHRIHQIEAKGACLQFVVGVRHAKAKVDSRVIYNPDHFTDPSGSVASVYKRSDGDLKRRELNLACGRDGLVHSDHRRDTKKVFRHAQTQTGAAG